MALELMYITNDPAVAKIAERAGVDRIWIDLETLGKQERQGHMDSVKSHHSIGDIGRMKMVLTHSRLQVRINPIHAGSEDEIDRVIHAGAQLVMLPMFKTAEEVGWFLQLTSGRVRTILLFETKEAVEAIDEILTLPGIDEVHIGLNDLHLSYKKKFMFELLSDGTVEYICGKVKKKNKPYGFGGIASLGTGLIPAEQIIAEHYRLGSTRVILSRSFCNTEQIKSYERIQEKLEQGIYELRQYESRLEKEGVGYFRENRERLRKKVDEIVKKMEESNRKSGFDSWQKGGRYGNR